MTCIAYRGGVMAADSGSWAGDASHGWALKLARTPTGNLYGVCGRADEATTFLRWVEDGMPGDVVPCGSKTDDGQSSYIVLAAYHNGNLELITAYGRERFTDAPYMAIGPEAAAALGAMYVGAPAPFAVEAACEHGDRARKPVRFISRDLPGVSIWKTAPR